MLKAPHSLRQINDVLIIVAVCGAPLGSANVRVGRNCVRECVFLLQEHKQRGGKVGGGAACFGHVAERLGKSLGTQRLFKVVCNFFFLNPNQWRISVGSREALSNRSLSLLPVLSSQISIIPASRPKIKI